MENLEQGAPAIQTMPAPAPRRGRGWKIAWGILLLLLIADIAGGTWLYMEYKEVKAQKADLEQEVKDLRSIQAPAPTDVEEVVWYTEGFSDDYCVKVDLGQGDEPAPQRLAEIDSDMEALFGDRREAFLAWTKSASMDHELQTSYKHCLMGEYGFTIKRTLNFSKNEYSLYAARFDQAENRFWGANDASGWTFQAAWETDAQEPTMFYDNDSGHQFIFLTYGTESMDTADPITLTRQVSVEGVESIMAPLVSVCQKDDGKTLNCLYTRYFE